MWFILGRDYLWRTKHFQGWINNEQVMQLSDELLGAILRAENPPKELPEEKYKRGGLDFVVSVRNIVQDLELKLKRNWLYKTSNLHIGVRGYRQPIDNREILDELDRNFNYSKLIEIANRPHGRQCKK